MNDIFLQVLGSIGGAAVVVGALVTWLGKVWADRMSKNHEHGLATLAEQQKQALASISDALTFRFQLDGISHIALPKPKGMRG